jgi:hypothetical protein
MSVRVDICGDCAVMPGEPHEDGCDVARCLRTGMQRLSCTSRHDCGQDVWTGEWPGDADCRRLGWLTPDGRPDVNRLNPLQARWDRQALRWEALCR